MVLFKINLKIFLQGKTIEKQLIENLVFPDLDTKAEAIWSLLLYVGYLNVLSTHSKGFRLMAQVSVPNKEVMHIYDEIVTSWFRKSFDFSTYDKFIDSLTSGKTDNFKLYLSKYPIGNGSYFDFNKNTPEKVFHSFMLGLVVGLKENYPFNLTRNQAWDVLMWFLFLKMTKAGMVFCLNLK